MLASIFENGFVTIVLVLLFGLSIFVHEFGHFLVARACGFVVDVFAIGFGPAIWKTRRKGILYKVGCIPMGGYVALPQLDPAAMSAVQGGDGGEGASESDALPERVLPPVKPWQKILVSIAGASGNIVLAIILAWVVYLVGIPAGPSERSATMGYVDPRSEAYAAGLRVGDTVEQVNGRPVEKWSDFLLEAALNHEVDVVVRSQDGRTRDVRLSTQRGLMGEQQVPGLEGRNLSTVLSVEPGRSAEKAGIRSGDTIIEFDGREVFSRAHLVELVAAAAGRETPIKVVRQGRKGPEVLSMAVTAEVDEQLGRPRIGIAFNTMAVDQDTVIHPLPSEQLRSHAGGIFRFLRALATPRQSRAASNAVGGPVAIVASYWVIAKTSIMLAIWFTGFLNVNLAILNLLPIPVLDGGHIVFSLWEMVMRRPVHARVINVLVNGFALLLIALFVMLSVRDVDRFTPAGRYLRRLLHITKHETPPAAAEPSTNAAPAAAVENGPGTP